MPLSSREQRANDYIIVNTASTMRVLNVLRHWLTKHPLVSVIFHMNNNQLSAFRIFILIRNLKK
jgi:hypothetical protein